MPAPNKESYRIMGIDPGTNYMGYGVVEVTGRELRSVVIDRKSTRLNSSHVALSRMPSSA